MTTSAESSWVPLHKKDSILHQAAFIGDVKKVKSLLAQESEHKWLNFRNWLGCTPIRLAATAGHEACVARLIDNGADVNVPDVKGQTPLFVAVKNKHVACLHTLLSGGADPDGDSQNICSPLYLAANDGNLKAVKLLIAHGANLDGGQMHVGHFLPNPAYIALVYQHFDCCKALLDAGASLTADVSHCRSQQPPGKQEHSDAHAQRKSPDDARVGKYAVGFEHARNGCRAAPPPPSPPPPHPPPIPASLNRTQAAEAHSLFRIAVERKVDPRFIQLLYDHGASLNLAERDRQFLSNLRVTSPSNAALMYFSVLENPRSLQSLCRIWIREVIGPSRLQKIDSLPLPGRLKSYLKHQH